MRSIVIAAMIVLSPSAAATQEIPELETDRPDQTETATVVPRGSVQVETGFVYEHDQPGSSDATFDSPYNIIERTAMQLPTMLVRVGVLDWLELRGELELARTETISVCAFCRGAEGAQTNVSATGLGAPALGVKVALMEEKGAAPQMALIMMATLPVGDSAFRSDDLGLGARLTMSHTLGDVLSVGYNLGLEYDDPDRDPAGLYTLAVALGLSDVLGVYGEVFGTARNGVAPEHMVDAGVTLLALSNLQLDASFGVAINEAAPDYYVGAGVSFRLPR